MNHSYVPFVEFRTVLGKNLGLGRAASYEEEAEAVEETQRRRDMTSAAQEQGRERGREMLPRHQSHIRNERTNSAGRFVGLR